MKEQVLAKYGKGHRFSELKAKAFLNNYGFPDAEIEHARIVRNKKRYYLRLENTQPGYFYNVVEQTRDEVFKPKRHNSKQTQQQLCALLVGLAPYSSLDSDLG